MKQQETLWEFFKATGFIGAYLLYRQTQLEDQENGELPRGQMEGLAAQEWDCIKPGL